MPALPSSAWVQVFEELAAYSRRGRFNLTECTAWVRDRLAERGTAIGRAAVGFVVKGCLYGGVPLTSPRDPEGLRAGFLDCLSNRMQAAGGAVTDEDRETLQHWLDGSIGDGPAVEAS